MLSRRELLSGGVVGSLATAPEVAAEAQSSVDPQELQALREINKSLGSVESVLQRGMIVNQGAATAIRRNMELFIRAQGKWPDYMEIGTAIFFDIYDWHVRNRQQISVARQADGRYHMQFMFTILVLIPTNDMNFIGYPYDKG